MSNVAASVRARLLNVAKAQGVDFNQVLVRFALERILYRLSQSKHADRFLLKGALLFTLWYDMPHRATRDADLLGFGASDLESVAQTFRDIGSVAVDDGIVFDPTSVIAEEIRKDAGYAGARILIGGELAKARCKTQIDVGFGDAVTPAPVDSIYPVLLEDLPAPRLRTYPVYTVIAEKLHAIALLGMTNSRMKDYLDLSVLLERESLDIDLLAQAVKATFERRGMAVPAALPVGMTDEFANDRLLDTLCRYVYTYLQTITRRSRSSIASRRAAAHLAGRRAAHGAARPLRACGTGLAGPRSARRSLASWVSSRPASCGGHRPNINVAVFHSAKLSAAEVCDAYPPELRKRLMLTPDTPRDRDLRFWISYEAGCVFAALRHNGTLAQCEAVVCLVPPAWGDSAREQFGDKRVVVIGEPFSGDTARRLARSLSTYRRAPVEPSPRSLPSKASVASMAATSAGVKTSSRGKSSGHSTRSASLSQRVASSASILG